MPVSLTAKCAMLKDRDFCGKPPPPNWRQRRGSIGQVAEVWSKIRSSMEGASAKSAKGINNSRVVVKVTGLR